MSRAHNWTSQSVLVYSYKNERFHIFEVDRFHSETFRYILMNLRTLTKRVFLGCLKNKNKQINK